MASGQAGTGTAAASSPLRLVLDTNVCLDLFVFDDPRCARLAEALRAGMVEAVTCIACEEEWRAVLAYPQLALAPAVRARALDAFSASVTRLSDCPMPPGIRLPRCADPDDQKFLALAAGAGARWLISRDRALLTLHRRCVRQAGFVVTTPGMWSPPEPASAPDVLQGLSANPV